MQIGDSRLIHLIGFVALVFLASGSVFASTAAVVRSGLPGEKAALVTAIRERIKAAGYDIREISFEDLCDLSALKPSVFDLIVLPDSGTLPVRAAGSIVEYLKGGGDIIALNTPMWQSALIRVGGRWLTREEYEREAAAVPPEHVLFDFASTGATGWYRTSSDMEVQTTWSVEDAGPAPGQCSLHVSIPKLLGWDTLHHDASPNPFPRDHTLTILSAKGGPNTTHLAVEWVERDGSRWIAVIPLTTEWRRYILTPKDFRFWSSVPSRGYPGDCFRPENAAKLAIGLAFSHTASVGSGPHEYWVGPIGTSKMKPEYEEFLLAADTPRLDTLSPRYKFFDSRDVSRLFVREDQTIVDRTDLPMPAAVRSVQPRPTVNGFDKGRDWRWIPIVEASSSKGEWRGVPVAVTVYADGPYKGGIWASFGVSDQQWYSSPKVLRLIEQIARRMLNPIFLVDGGANYYTYFRDQKLVLGATVANLGSDSHGMQIRMKFAGSRTFQPITRQVSTQVPAGKIRIVCCEIPVPKEHNQYNVTCELVQGGKVIDRAAHQIHVWEPKKQKYFVSVANGEFRLRGNRWRPHGVNYMPSSGIGTEDGAYFEYWLDRRSYDPEVIQRDLDHIKDMGFNSVSIFIYSHSTEAQNLLDILRLLDNLGLKANLSLRPGTPMDFRWSDVKKIIEYYRLWENDTVFAYDLAWEPMFGSHQDRKIWDRDWEAWVVERYGSIENAEKDWGFPIPRDESGQVTNPLPEHIDTDGEWRVMVAAYRRFLDTLLYKKYSEARRLVLSIDPNHLVSFRMAEAGNPTFRWPNGRIPYDFAYLAGAVDFLAPEAYGRMGDWERTKPGWFEREYARWAAPTKPMIWAEAGVNTWDISRMENSPERLSFAAEVYRNFYRLLIESAADGVFFWWYPGGFRVGENSDFGIIEPDGTDREVTRVIREWGPKFVNGPSLKPVDQWITIDRDRYPNGITGVYQEVQDAFWSALALGKTPGLRTEGTGTNSCNSPDLAVGNTKPNGTNPLKYLDAAFDLVEVKMSNGDWHRVLPNQRLRADRSGKLTLRMKLTNLGESKWSPEPKCRVSLLAFDSEGRLIARFGLNRPVARFESVEIPRFELSIPPASHAREIVLRLSAEAKGFFGEVFKVVLEP